MDLQQTPIRSSLNRFIGIAGGERLLVLISLVLAVYVGGAVSMGKGLLIGIPFGFAIWTAMMFVLVRMGSEDMQMSSVFRRHRLYREYYPAHGRLDCNVKPIKDFVQ